MWKNSSYIVTYYFNKNMYFDSFNFTLYQLNMFLICLELFYEFIYTWYSSLFNATGASIYFRSCKQQFDFISGGGGGIGRSLALEFAKRNARIIVWDINKVSTRAISFKGISHFFAIK